MRRIAFIGTSGTGNEAPFADKSWEIWGCAARGAYVTRADRWFEVHRISGEPAAWQINWRAQMQKFSHDLELWMFYPEPELGPKVIQYPYEHITARFGTYFMTSSFSWMMALAIDEMCPEGGEWHPGQIGIWGVEMEYGTEYRQQRSGFRHFIDLARVVGIDVTRRVDSGLSYEPVPYPLWQDDPLIAKLEQRVSKTKATIIDYDRSRQDIRSMVTQNEAVVGEIERSKKKGYRRAKRLEELKKETTNLIKSSADLTLQIAEAKAAREELRYLRDYLEP